MWSPRMEYLWLIFFPVLMVVYSVLAGVICELYKLLLLDCDYII